jgi:hypothetical protein
MTSPPPHRTCHVTCHRPTGRPVSHLFVRRTQRAGVDHCRQGVSWLRATRLAACCADCRGRGVRLGAMGWRAPVRLPGPLLGGAVGPATRRLPRAGPPIRSSLHPLQSSATSTRLRARRSRVTAPASQSHASRSNRRPARSGRPECRKIYKQKPWLKLEAIAEPRGESAAGPGDRRSR